MKKRLVVCCDGTWNTPEQEDNGLLAPTNVVKLYNAADDGIGTQVAQVKYYHPGVGTAGGLDTVTGGAVGAGVSKQIRSAYHWLATNYAEGDDIFLFGFSRGAFIVRSLGGLLGRGLLNLGGVSPKEGWARVDAAFDLGYRRHKSLQDDDRKWVGADWKFFHGDREPAPVRFIGVWDTVGALGVPDDFEILNLFDRREIWQFHDTTLGRHIRTARHAMALDEVRASFTVTRWQAPERKDGEPEPDLQEKWFPGSHSDVGGGYVETDLSDGALLWMMQEAEKAGLSFREGVFEMPRPNPLGHLHNSYKGAFAKLRSRPRSIEAMLPSAEVRFHQSARQRQAKSPIAYPAYHPTRILGAGDSASIDVFAKERWNRTGLYLESGQTYTFSATGEWIDGRDACDWRGTEANGFSLGDVSRAIGTAFGKLEDGIMRLTDNASTDFLGTKRAEKYPWFALIGAITNDRGDRAIVPNDGSPSPHQYVHLPDFENKGFTVEHTGYLYCFANDAWRFYGNNAGSVRLTVTRVS